MKREIVSGIFINCCLDCDTLIDDRAKRCCSCAQTGRKLSKETIRRMIKSKRGFKHSKQSKKKMSLSKMGNINGRGLKGKKVSKETGRKISLAKKGKKFSIQHRINMSLANGGDGDIKRLGEKESYVMLNKQWVKQIFERDNYTCALCKERGLRLNAHHIKKKSMYPKLRFKTNNGITLCVECHKGIHDKEENYEIIFNVIAEVNTECAC